MVDGKGWNSNGSGNELLEFDVHPFFNFKYKDLQKIFFKGTNNLISYPSYAVAM